MTEHQEQLQSDLVEIIESRYPECGEDTSFTWAETLTLMGDARLSAIDTADLCEQERISNLRSTLQRIQTLTSDLAIQRLIQNTLSNDDEMA